MPRSEGKQTVICLRYVGQARGCVALATSLWLALQPTAFNKLFSTASHIRSLDSVHKLVGKGQTYNNTYYIERDVVANEKKRKVAIAVSLL